MGSREMREDSCVPCRWGEGAGSDSKAELSLAVKAWGISWGAYTHSHREAQGVWVWGCVCGCAHARVWWGFLGMLTSRHVAHFKMDRWQARRPCEREFSIIGNKVYSRQPERMCHSGSVTLVFPVKFFQRVLAKTERKNNLEDPLTVFKRGSGFLCYKHKHLPLKCLAPASLRGIMYILFIYMFYSYI